jgi:isopentenyl diphosphate isomerase/L-lactate dehydrogenase-like FMN-dependent dehydrogenase
VFRQRRMSNVVSVDEMRIRARRLPRAVFDVIDGGATDEVTLRANRTAFDRIWLRPRLLADVHDRDISTTVLGQPISMPLMLDPCGFAWMANSGGELAVARAAAKANTIFVVSGAASYPLEVIAQAASGPLWYQLYLAEDRQVAEALIDRVERAGYPVLCVTLDSAVSAKRERDFRNKVTVPLKISPRLLLSGISNPIWAKDFLLGKVGRQGDAPSLSGLRTALWNLANTVQSMNAVTAADLEWIRGRWKGKLVVKGVMRGEECSRMVDIGVDGIVVSNHGGRNLDGVRPAIEVLPEVVNEVHGRVEVFVDGGIRRGTDVMKALALGARACLIGRPYMFGLAAGGEEGVARVLQILRDEIDQTMGHMGCATVRDIDQSLICTSS